MKTLYIISKGIAKRPDEEIARLEKENTIPRVLLLEKTLGAELLDERYLSDKTPLIRRMLYKLIPVNIAQIIESLFILNRYDVILSHSEKVSLPLALIMKYLGIQKPHVAIISRITSVDMRRSNQKIWFLKRVKDSVTKFLIWSSKQREIAIERFGVDPEKIVLLKRGTDQKYWRPLNNVNTDMICSVGMEARDYPTLVEALRPLDIPCHIAVGASRGEIFNTVKKLYNIKDLPENITVGSKSHYELRKLYARCRFVVVSLMPTDSDNGLTTILESMAMGKPVICSRAEGQIDIIRDGVTGIYVPQGNPEAMQYAIQDLWDDPERCKRMGTAARKFIEENHSLEQFVQEIKHEVDLTVNNFEDKKPQTRKLEKVEA